MPDLTITITTVEARVLESYYITAQDGAESAVRKLVRAKARDSIYDSSSEKDPRKMDDQELRDELIVVQAEIPTFCERPQNIDHPDCVATSL